VKQIATGNAVVSIEEKILSRSLPGQFFPGYHRRIGLNF